MTTKPRNNERLIPWSELQNMVPYTRQHLLRLEKQGRFPRRLKVGPGRIAWLESEIWQWIELRSHARVSGTSSLVTVVGGSA